MRCTRESMQPSDGYNTDGCATSLIRSLCLMRMNGQKAFLRSILRRLRAAAEKLHIFSSVETLS